VDLGEAAIGRSSFADIRDGKTPAWGKHPLKYPPV
jgi:hypothetical protein